MEQAQASQSRIKGLSRRTVLGMPGAAPPPEGVRAIQHARAPQIMHMQVIAQAAAALATLWLLGPDVRHPVLFGWLALVSAMLAWGVHAADRLAHGGSGRRAAAHLAGALTANAGLWAAAAYGFGAAVNDAALMEQWTVVAILMTVWAVAVPALPQAAVLFIGLTGAGAVAAFLSAGQPVMAAIAALYTLTIALGAVQAGRDFLLSRLAETGMAEHREVVSLLLKEFEDAAADWLWETDTRRRVRAVSRRFAMALGHDPAEVEGRSLVRLLAGDEWGHGDVHASLYDLAERLTRQESFSNLLVQARVAGETRWWTLSGKPRVDEQDRFAGFRGVGSDVTAQRESSDKIEWLARYDTLTGLPNRLMLTEAIAEAMRHAVQTQTRCAFLMLDLDRFKAVNDTLGHHVGDHLLAAVSERLQSLMDEGETCGRLGGDEFAIVIREVADTRQVDRLATRAIELLSQPYSVDAHTLYVGASIGSALAPRDGGTVETLMRNADLALYRAKDEGGGRHCTYEPGLHAQAEERRVLEVALRGAIEREELALNYQPVVDAGDERILALEALVRWEHPQYGVISPSRFVPIAEDTRLIVPIGIWVLRNACRQAMRWPAHVRLAVNISAEQLLDSGFLDTLVAALAESGLPPQRLELEVTESVFVRDANTVRTVLEGALALGCAVSLDDFGTGYSSLGYLRTLRFSTIKIDRSFVRGGATGNLESLAVIRAVVAMAESLEMSTTAEGVETDAELAMVRRLGCRSVQGYHFGRPMVGDEAVLLFGRRSVRA